MFNKINILILLFLVINTSTVPGEVKNIHSENTKNIEKNNKNIKLTRDKLLELQKNHNEEFKKIESTHNIIKSQGDNLNHVKYNELVKKYGDMVKNYNSKRKNICAELPPLWVLKNKLNPEESIMENNCNKWYYSGRESGLIMGKALYLLGRIHFYSVRFRERRMSCYRTALFLKSADKSTVHYRNCYLKGFNEQIFKTIDGLRDNKFILLKFNNPFKNLEQKNKELKNIIRTIKK